MENIMNKLKKLGEKIKLNSFAKYIIVLLAGLVAGLTISVSIVAVKLIIDEIRFKPIVENKEEETTEIVIKDKEELAEAVLTVSTVSSIVKPASELVALKYYYTDADTYENYKELFGIKIPLTTDRVVFTYDGVMSVGIDLSEVEYIIDNEKKSITIKMPDVKILSNDIDENSFAFPYESDSIFNKTDFEDYTELLGALEKSKEAALLANTDFMDDALENAEDVIKQLLTVADETKEYKVEFK